MISHGATDAVPQKSSQRKSRVRRILIYVLLLIVAGLAVALYVSYVRRSEVVAGILRSVLSRQDIQITSIQVSEFETDRAVISDLELNFPSGMSVRSRGVSLTYSTPGLRARQLDDITIEELSVKMPASTDAPESEWNPDFPLRSLVIQDLKFESAGSMHVAAKNLTLRRKLADPQALRVRSFEEIQFEDISVESLSVVLASGVMAVAEKLTAAISPASIQRKELDTLNVAKVAVTLASTDNKQDEQKSSNVLFPLKSAHVRDTEVTQPGKFQLTVRGARVKQRTNAQVIGAVDLESAVLTVDSDGDAGKVKARTKLDVEVVPFRFEIPKIDLPFDTLTLKNAQVQYSEILPPIMAEKLVVLPNHKNRTFRTTLGRIRSEIFGGAVQASSLAIDSGASSLFVPVELSSMDLGKILALYESQGVSGEGTLDGTIPVTLKDGFPTVEGGVVRARPPGGHIRYRTDSAVNAVAANHADSRLKQVYAVLENYQYSNLEAKLSYNQAGDLISAIAIEGKNPDLNSAQPVNVNLNLEQNVPKLIRSLALSRDLSTKISDAVTGK